MEQKKIIRFLKAMEIDLCYVNELEEFDEMVSSDCFLVFYENRYKICIKKGIDRRKIKKMLIHEIGHILLRHLESDKTLFTNIEEEANKFYYIFD